MKIFILKDFAFNSDMVVDRGGDLKSHWYNTLLLDASVTHTDNESERHFCEEVKHKLHSVLLPPNQKHQKVMLLPIYYSHSGLLRQLSGAPVTTPVQLGEVSGLPQCPPPGFCGLLVTRYIKSVAAYPMGNVSSPAQRRRRTKAGAGGTYCSARQGGSGTIEDDNPQIFLTMGLRSDGTLNIRLVGTILEKLRILYGDNYTMKLEIKEMKLSKMYHDLKGPGLEEYGAETAEPKKLFKYVIGLTVDEIQYHSGCTSTHQFACFGAEIPTIFPPGVQAAWNAGWFPISASISLQVSFPRATDELVKDKWKMNKRILTEEIETDATIVAKNGAIIKCHRAFLCAMSPVFAGMFRSDMKEKETGQIELVNESERAIRALLAYLYYWDLEDPNKDLSLALELLQIAHQYDFTDLHAAIEKLLIARPHQYFSLDVALDVFCFARKAQSFAALRTKAVQVVKFHASALDKSWKYRELFIFEIDAARELCKCAFLT